MRANRTRWLTVQQAATALDSTGAEICRLLGIGRLSGIKRKQARRPGKAQWLINPASITKEKRIAAHRAKRK